MITMLTGISTHRITKNLTSSFLIFSGRNVHAAKRAVLTTSHTTGLSKKAIYQRVGTNFANNSLFVGYFWSASTSSLAASTD